MPNGCRTKNGDCMGDEGKAVGIAQAPAALLSAFHHHENTTRRDYFKVRFSKRISTFTRPLRPVRALRLHIAQTATPINRSLTMQSPNRDRLGSRLLSGNKQMFGKTDLLETLTRDLARARRKRDVLTSDVTALATQIVDLEIQISAENDRRERERAASKIEEIKEHLKDLYSAFAPTIAGFQDGTEKAEAIVPEAREFTNLLRIIAAEITNATDTLLGDLDGRVSALRAGLVIPEQLQSLGGSPDLQQDNDREFLRLPEWLAQRKARSTQDRCCAAVA